MRTWLKLLTLIVLSVVVLPASSVLAASQQTRDAINYDSEFYDPGADGCSSTASSTVTGSYTTILQAIALHESSGNPTAGSPGAASGKFQFEPETWNANKGAYPPANQYTYASAAPEDVQDAVAYLWGLNAYKQYGQSPFWMGIFWYDSGYLSKAYPNQAAAVLNYAPPGNNGLTLAAYGNTIAQAVQSGQYQGKQLSSVPMPFPADFQTYLTQAGGAPADASTTAAPASAPATSGGCPGSTTCSSGGGSVTSPGAAILCEAEKYNGIYYQWGGGHGYQAFRAACPEAALASAASGSTPSNPGPCATDCSGLVSVAVDGAYSQTFSWSVSTSGQMTDGGKDWQEIPLSEVQAGDIATKADATGHVEIIVSYANGQLTTFGSHQTGTQTGTVPSSPSYWNHYFAI